jgi:hypothetical protein
MIGIGIGLRHYRLKDSMDADPDYLSFYNRVVSAGGFLTTTEQIATNQLVKSMKDYGIWSSMKAIYPMVGSSAAACAQNLKSTNFTGTFTSGWTFAYSGATPNGINAYMNTGYEQSVNGSLNNVHISYYSRTNLTGGGNIGSFVLTPTPSFTHLYAQYVDGKAYLGLNSTEASTPNSTAFGLYIGSRINSSSIKLYKNNTTLLIATQTSVSLPSGFVSIGATRNGLNGTFDYGKLECAFASIGEGLTDTQASDLYTAIQEFQTTLFRTLNPQSVSDADAQAYINRVYTAGGILTNKEAAAVNQLVIDMKSANIWSSMKAVYPMVGSSAASCAQNLKSSSFTGTFTSGWTFNSTGATPNGTSAYMDTNIIPASHLSLNSVHFSNYLPNFVTENRCQIGCTDAAPPNKALYAYYRYDNTLGSLINVNNSTLNAFINSDQTTNSGMRIVSRTSSTLIRSYVNNTSSYSSNAVSTGLSSFKIVVSARNLANSIGDFSSLKQSFVSIGDGLSDTQALDLYNAVQTFQTTLNRQVAP